MGPPGGVELGCQGVRVLGLEMGFRVRAVKCIKRR